MEAPAQGKQIQQLIVDSLSFLVKKGSIKLYGFTFMMNQLHLVWQLQPAHKTEDVQRDFLKYTVNR